jgi:Cys-tRNA(Pro)/Cys-tRNA(Cys) deacylase
MKQPKTNTLRLLEKAGISYTPYEYDTSDGLLDGVSVAHKTGLDVAAVFKTLAAKAADGRVLVFCVPVAKALDLKKAAKAAGAKSVAMLPVAQITPITGYVKGGCSPVGMKKLYPTFIDATAETLSAVAVSGGRVGLQVQLVPQDLQRLVNALFSDIVN